jgi:hypothetical protein
MMGNGKLDVPGPKTAPAREHEEPVSAVPVPLGLRSHRLHLQSQCDQPAAVLARSPDPLWQHTAAAWLRDMAGLGAVTLLYTFITWRRLAAHSPGRRPGPRLKGLASRPV